jgi:hypothetical protein
VNPIYDKACTDVVGGEIPLCGAGFHELKIIDDHNLFHLSSLSIAGAGCGLTGVGAGEEARKVVAGEASRCGEDK